MQDDNQSIFSNDFQSELRRNKHNVNTLKLLKKLNFFLIILNIILFIGIVYFYTSTLPFFKNTWVLSNPLNITGNTSELNDQTNQSTLDTSKTKEETRGIAKEYEALLNKNYVEEAPILSIAYDLNKKKVDWYRATIGLDQVIQEIVSANKILQKITYSVIVFDSDTKKIVIDNLRAIGDYLTEDNTNKSGTSISLATKIVDALEQSKYFKDVKAEEFAKKSNSEVQEAFTPLTLQFFLQEPDETNAKDKLPTIDEELNNVSSSGSIINN